MYVPKYISTLLRFLVNLSPRLQLIKPVTSVSPLVSLGQDRLEKRHSPPKLPMLSVKSTMMTNKNIIHWSWCYCSALEVPLKCGWDVVEPRNTFNTNSQRKKYNRGDIIYGRNQSGCEKAKKIRLLPSILWIFLCVYTIVKIQRPKKVPVKT